MDDPGTLLIVAAINLLVFTIVTTVYYYESIRGEAQSNTPLDRKAEQMFAWASGLTALCAVGIALLLWLPEAEWVIVANKANITADMIIVAYSCVRWMLGCWVSYGWYYLPWKSLREGQFRAQASSKAPRPDR